MRNKILLIGGTALLAYIAGSQAHKADNKNYEDFRHQAERLWSDPHAKKSRTRARKQLTKLSRDITRKAMKAIRSRTAG